MAISHLIGIVSYRSSWMFSVSPTRLKSSHEHRKTDGHLSTNLLDVRVLWLCADRPVAALYDPLEVRRTGAHAGGYRDRNHWRGSLIASGMPQMRDSLLSLRSTPKTPPRLRDLSGDWGHHKRAGHANGEISADLWACFGQPGALRTGGLPKGLNILGVLVGAVGIITIISSAERFSCCVRPGSDHLVRLAGDRHAAQQPKHGGAKNRCVHVAPQHNKHLDFKFQQQTRVLERLTLNISNFEKKRTMAWKGEKNE